MLSVRLRKLTARCRSSSTRTTRCRILRPSRSSFQTTNVSPGDRVLAAFLIRGGPMFYRSFCPQISVHILTAPAHHAAVPCFVHLLIRVYIPLASAFPHAKPRMMPARQKNCIFLNVGLGDGSALPVGVPVPWPTATAPAGWLKCNGAAFTAQQYPKLALAYPALKLPDLRSEFIRGWDDGRGVDSGRTLLSWQKGSYLVQERESAVDNIVQFSLNTLALLGWDKSENNGDLIRARAIQATSTWTSAPSNSDGVQYMGYARPRNIAFNYIVRAA